MKRLLLILAILATLPAIAQTEVNSFMSGTNEGITYCLPDTKIEITVNAVCITRTPGEFSRYAERYLRIDNAITDAESFWEMTEATADAVGMPNAEKRYTIKLNNSTAANIVLDGNGIIESINGKNTIKAEKENTTAVTVKQHNDASRYMTGEMFQATSTAKLAELTAKEIYTVRESKLAITRGLSENMPQDGQSMKMVLDELDKQEKALTELFTGRSDTLYCSRTYTIVPEAGCDTTKAVLFRFSRKFGFLDKDDLAGEPVYYNMHDLRTVKLPTPDELANKKVIKKEGVCYNVPGKAGLTLFTRSRKLFNGDIQAAQLGTTEVLSKDLFKKNSTTRIIFDTATGGIISIEK